MIFSTKLDTPVENIHATYDTPYRGALYLVITNPASAPEILISMSVVHEEDLANQMHAPGVRIMATMMYSKNNHDDSDIDMERKDEDDPHITIHSDGITRVVPRVDFNAGLQNYLSISRKRKEHDAMAIIAQRNAMIEGLYDGQGVNGHENAAKTKASKRPRKLENKKHFEEDLAREQTSQPVDYDYSESSGCSSDKSSGVMMGRNSASRSSIDLSYGVTTAGNSRGYSSGNISSGVMPKGNLRGFSSAAYIRRYS